MKRKLLGILKFVLVVIFIFLFNIFFLKEMKAIYKLIIDVGLGIIIYIIIEFAESFIKKLFIKSKK